MILSLLNLAFKANIRYNTNVKSMKKKSIYHMISREEMVGVNFYSMIKKATLESDVNINVLSALKIKRA